MRVLLLVAAALAAAVPSAPPARGQEAGPAELLAEAIRHRTVSGQDEADFDAAAFRGFHAFLAESFPRVHAALGRHEIGGWSLLYEWPGSDPDALPILVTAHFDVVPAEAEAWTHPPFAGVIADGFVWGRGALDDKSGVIGALAAAEALLAERFAPRRTIYLAFGHDEEVGGEDGAGATAAWLEARDVRLLFTLDEGMTIAEGSFPGVDRPFALIGIAEKGYMTVRLTARAPGGHSSMPPRESAIGRLARAVARVEDRPMPARMGGVVGGLLDAAAPHLPLLQRIALGNRWLFGPVVEGALAGSPASDAMLRTTTAVTMIEAGVKENVLPTEATATVNFRLAPGDSADAVLAHVREAVDDPEVEIEVGRITEPSPVADVDSAAYALIADTIREVAPEVVVAPGLVLGGTDTKHYVDLAENSFRFTPYRLGPDDVARVHGIDERIAVDNLETELVPFYRLLLQNAQSL